MRMRKLTPYLKHPLIKVENAKVIYPSVKQRTKENSMKLKVNRDSREIIEGIIHPAEKEYIAWVADTLNCEIEDLVLLDSLNPEDEEGDYLSSFFPANSKLQEILIHDDLGEKQIPALMFDDFSVGVVFAGNYKGIPFIADQNASPFAVYVNQQNLSGYES